MDKTLDYIRWALSEALDASTPDGDSWINGWNAFWPDNPRPGLDRFKQLVRNLLKNDA